MPHGTLNLLLIEDSASDVELLLHALRRGGYQVNADCVATEQDLRAALDRRPWDLIITDFHVPGLDAVAALHVLRERGDSISCIVLTGSPEQAALEMGASSPPIVAKGDWPALLRAIEEDRRI